MQEGIIDMTTESIETVIIGGGQAGLATSYWLTQFGREHVVLEKASQAGQAWRQRWDSFTLVTPNWTFRLPGAEYNGPDPDGFMPRDHVITAFEQYVRDHRLPVTFGAEVTAVEPLTGAPGYLVATPTRTYRAYNVVMATGLYQRARIPPYAAALPAQVTQLHSEQYRNPAALPPGAVLIIGSGQSGCQIAEELNHSGRHVFLCVGSAGRAPRRYRGRDTYTWLALAGFFDRTPDMLPSAMARFAANPHVSGAGGGHNLNLHQFAHDGITLLGHLRGTADGVIGLATDLYENLARTDQVETMLLDMIDAFIERQALDAPGARPPTLRTGFEQPIISELDVAQAGITTVIWAAGYDFDFNLVRLPVVDNAGFPQQNRGVTNFPGLYFVGLPWLHTQKSGLLMGVGEDAAYIARHIRDRLPA